jgi:predicted alpha/beta-hydrolase family hydrolase
MAFIKGVVFFGFPLHAPGNPSTSRADHLKSVPVPMLFLQGTRDALADLKLIQQVTSGLKATKLVTFDGADHSFKAGKNILIPELAEATSTWINDLRIK